MPSSLRLWISASLGLVAAIGACAGQPPPEPPRAVAPDAGPVVAEEPDAPSEDASVEDAAVVAQPEPKPAEKKTRPVRAI
ncbi:MAG: hypothetical protein U0165_18820 [Polyangiaceae bacterium]